MDSRFIQERISILRTKKGVSEYRMSLDLGHSKGYINSISSGKSLPSVAEFLCICDYLGVTPKEFFDEELDDPQLVRQLCDLTKDIPEEILKVLVNVAGDLNKKDK